MDNFQESTPVQPNSTSPQTPPSLEPPKFRKWIYVFGSVLIVVLSAVAGKFFLSDKSTPSQTKSQSHNQPDNIPQQNVTSAINPIIIKSGDFSLTVTKDDIRIDESYLGATWTNDSHGVYLAKYISIKLSAEKIDQLEQQLFQQLMEEAKKISPDKKGNEKVVEETLGKLPKIADFKKTLFEQLIVFRYNIIDKQLDLVTTTNLTDYSYPLDLSFRDSLDGNTLQYGDSDGIHKLDLGVLSWENIGSIDGWINNSHFIDRKDYIAPADLKNGYKERYLSPDRHAFIEIRRPHQNFDFYYDKKSGFNFASDIVGIYSNSSTQLKTLEELGWGGGVPPDYMLSTLNQYQPQYFINVRLMRTPQEKEIRTRLQID